MGVSTTERIVIIRPEPRLGVPQRPLRRAQEGVVAGVCLGLAVRLGLRARTIQIFFVVASIAFGAGALLYAALWLLLVRSGETDSIVQRLTRRRAPANLVIIGLLAAMVLLVALHSLGAGWFGVTLVVAVTAIAGGALGVWGASHDERAHLRSVIEATPLSGALAVRGWRAVAWRVVPGIALLVVGMLISSHLGGLWSNVVPAFLGGAAVVGGVLLLLAPWWLQSALDLSKERRERVRIQERAAVAAHLHDSVLQTLTLIERVAEDPAQVRRIARTQERELRQWLYDPRAGAEMADSLAVALGGVVADVEADYQVRVELVVVGDAPMDDVAGALVSAAKEASVNAAKWSGADVVALFCEVDTTRISIFVRDAGRGFDLGAVPEDRHGIRSSICSRVESVGGTASVRSTPGEGTEVALSAERAGTKP